MTEYYNQKENQVLHQINEPYLGQIVAAMLLNDNKWYRAEIVAIQPSETDDLVLDVYFLDYGDQQFVTRKDILELRADFLSLRFQAIECFLAHVQPTNTGSKFEEWDRDSIEAFESLVQVAQWKKLISKVVAYKERKSFALQRPSNKRESSPVPGVELYEDNLENNIALQLVKRGCAEVSDRFGDLAKSLVLNVVSDEEGDDSEAIENNTKESVVVEEKEDDETTKVAAKKQLEPEKEILPEQPIVQSLKPEEPAEESLTSNNSKLDHNDNETLLLSNGNGTASKAEVEVSNPEPANLFGDNSIPIKPPKKKRNNATADFLKNEQESSHASKKKKSKNVDWNTMLDE
jgi:tudor domain-containing protein 2